MGKQELKELQKRIKAIEDALGLGSGASKNINLLLDTVRGQGEQIGQQQMQIIAADAAASLRDDFIKKIGMKTEFQKFLAVLAPKPPETRPPTEPVEFNNKEHEDGHPENEEVIHAPGMITPHWTMCGELSNTSRIVQHGEAVGCEKCIAELNKTKEPEIIDHGKSKEIINGPVVEKPKEIPGRPIKPKDPPRSTLVPVTDKDGKISRK